MEVQKKRTRKKIVISIVAIIVITIGIIIYQLADRYLIEHVEVSNALNNTVSAEQTAESNTTNTIEEDYSADDWSYTSDTKSITIKKVTAGSSSNPIVYYVADVTLKSGSTLKSAFANNEFGNNITQNTSVIAKENNAIFAINGDYYGFRQEGITIRNGQIFRDIPARTGLALYKDGSMKIYEETETTAEELVEQGVTQTLSFGPALVENSSAITDFGQVSIDTNFGNRSIQDANPRTGIGIISPNHYVFIIVDGRSEESQGMTLTDFAKTFEDLGCTEAYNLDGGGSSTMYFMGRVVNNPLGKGQERGVSDILFIN
ncbi:phosphodiester glycosidase family protein [Bacillus sp. USDA818B3_A]|uniref:phosphodiester glycosidase family protein n=1 Tax=Bacillus sp. USDA818B3_A TaxID=2698834 RepID=UPI0013687B15|nr:phosphodiester glycosidase family protein [Bacillus sp. USDA818B3_A]